MIYRYCLLAPECRDLRPWQSGERLRETRLRFVSKQVNCEVLDVLYGETTHTVSMTTIHYESASPKCKPARAYL